MPLTRRVARREALPPPECLPFKPAKTLFQQRGRLQALKNQIRYPYALTDVILRRHLVANEWDVNAAAASFRREEEVALKNNTSPADESHYQSRRASTVGGSRLLAAADLRTQINNGHGQPVQLSHASLLGLLQSSRWDLKNALGEYEGYKDDLSDITGQFSHLRSKDPTDIEQDERLVEFITLTSTESIASAERLLVESDWDFVRAVNGWSRLGYLPIIKPKRDRSGQEVVNRGRRAVFVNRHPRNGNDEPLLATTTNTYDEKVDTDEWPSDAEAEDSEFEDDLRPTYGTSKRQGFAIDIDREPARVGCPDATKLRIETISNGKYKCAWLPGKSGRKNKVYHFRWTDGDDNNNDDGVGAEDENADGSGARLDSDDLAVVAIDEENTGASADDKNRGASADDENVGASRERPNDEPMEIEFDWNNSEHITFLNNWRRQYLFRVTNQASKTKTIPFNDTEDEWLWHKQAELLEEKWDELVGRTGSTEAANNFMADGNNFPLVAKASTWRRWEREFDAKFGGHIVAVGEPPRPFRSAGSLNTHSHRVGAIVTDFHLRLNKPHRKTTALAREEENEEGLGEEDQSEGEQGEETQGGVQE
jgi:hypothetical protein